jgi:branched-subunit amino acid transport protein
MNGGHVDALYALLTIAGLTLVTIVTRGFFILPKRSFKLPTRIERALKYAPIAALVAVIAPEVLLETSLGPAWIKVLAVIPAAGYYYWRRGILGTIMVGTGVFLILKFLLLHQ